MTTTLATGGSKRLVRTQDLGEREQFFINPDLTTLSLGSTTTFKWTIDKRGRYPVLDDIKIRFKCTNSSANDTWDIESLWHLVESLKIKFNDKECYEMKDNLTRPVFALRKLNRESKEAVQQREYVLTRGAGTGFHNSTTIAVSTTSSYYYASLNDVCDVFHDLRLCPLNSIGFELTMVNGTATSLRDHISYDNSTGSEALSTYFSLTSVDVMLETRFYNTPQTVASVYSILTTKFDVRNFSGTSLTTNYIASANQSFTIDLDDWHQIPNIVKVHIYGRDASADNGHKQYLGLGVISRIDIKKAGKTELETFSQYHLLEWIQEHRKLAVGASHWLLPNDSWVSGEEVPFISLDLTGRNRYLGDGVHAHEGIENKKVKYELVLWNDALTDANMTRLAVILESKHYIRIEKATGRVTSA